jgi:hypothetical protein
MVEIYNSGDCLLWEKTKTLAADNGLEMSAYCPLHNMCLGERCPMIEPIQKTADNLQKFYEKLEKHQTLKKLADLREELKNYERKEG